MLLVGPLNGTSFLVRTTEGSSGSHPVDFQLYLKNITLPAQERDEIYFRRVDADNLIKLRIFSSGAVQVINRDAGVESTVMAVVADTLSDGDTLGLKCDSNEGWLSVNSSDVAYTDEITETTGIAYLFADMDDGLRIYDVVFSAV